MDEVALARRGRRETGLGIGLVVAYIISGGDCISAYDPDGYPHSDEGYYNFSVTRYGYKDQEARSGLIITGYDMTTTCPGSGGVTSLSLTRSTTEVPPNLGTVKLKL